MSNSSSKANWKLVRFGDVVRQIKDRVADIYSCGLAEYTRGEHFESSNLHLIGRSQIGDGQHGSAFHMRFRKGDVLYVSRNPQLRKVAVADYDGICANTTYVLRADGENLLHELLPFIMQTESFVDYTIQHKRGSTNFYLNYSDIEPYEFPLPPLAEQRRIAELLWAVENTGEQYKITRNTTEILRLALIDEAINKFSDFVNLKDVCEKIIDGPHYPPKFINKGIPFILVSNLSSGKIDWKVSKWISELDYADIYKRINSEIGDVLYTVVGSFGVPVYVDWDKPYAFQRHIALLKPKKGVLDGVFLKCYLESSFGKQQAGLYAVGLAQKTLTLGALQKFSFPKVSIDDQRQIVEKVHQVDEALKSIDGQISSISEIKQGLLNGCVVET